MFYVVLCLYLWLIQWDWSNTEDVSEVEDAMQGKINKSSIKDQSSIINWSFAEL